MSAGFGVSRHLASNLWAGLKPGDPSGMFRSLFCGGIAGRWAMFSPHWRPTIGCIQMSRMRGRAEDVEMLGHATRAPLNRYRVRGGFAISVCLALALAVGLAGAARADEVDDLRAELEQLKQQVLYQIGRASCRERVCNDV